MVMQIEAVATALLIAALWGLSPILHKAALHELSAQTTFTVSFFMYMLCAIVYAFVYRDRIAEDLRLHATPKTIAYIAVGAMVCGFAANILYFHVLRDHDSHIVSALIYSCPVFTLVLAYLLLREHIHFVGFLGIVLITAGVVCIAFNPDK